MRLAHTIASLGLLGGAYGLVVGSSGKVSLALAPMLVAAAGAGLLAWRRRRGVRATPGDAERLLRVLALALVPGVGLAVLVVEPSQDIALVGAWVLAAAGALVECNLWADRVRHCCISFGKCLAAEPSTSLSISKSL